MADPQPIPIRPPSSAAASVTPVTLRGGRQVPTDLSARYVRAAGLSTVPREPGRDPQILRVIRILCDFDADASKAVSSFLRLGNTGHHVEVKDPSGARLPDGEARLDEFARRAWAPGGGGADVLAGALFLSFLQAGGAGIDIEITPDLRDIKDVYPYGPAAIVKRWAPDPVTGITDLLTFPAYGTPEQQRTAINPQQAPYLPLDPTETDVYGRPPLLPAIESLDGLARLVDDQEAAARIHGQGMRDVVLNAQATEALAPLDVQTDRGQALVDFLNGILAQIDAKINSLEFTDTFTHFDNVTVGMTTPGGQGVPIDPIMQIRQRRGVTGLKTMPVLLAENEGSTTTHATVQWQIQVAEIRTIQDLVRRLIERAYNTCLQIWGIPGTVTLEFDAIRDTDRTIEATAKATEQANAKGQYEDGLISHEEYGQLITGHAPVGDPPPTNAQRFAVQAARSQVATPPPAPVPPPAPALPPGSGAGLTATEGAALDQIAAPPSTAEGNNGSGGGGATGRQQESLADQWLRLRLAAGSGVITVNEARDGIGYDAVPEGDAFLVRPPAHSPDSNASPAGNGTANNGGPSANLAQ